MTEYSIYQVDAFTSEIFKGNPAAVMPLTEGLAVSLMQAIARENNLSETAFFTPSDQAEADFHLRWFTPGVEIDLCGHATLATAHVLINELDWEKETIRFSTEKAGILTVSKAQEGLLQLDFPARPGKEITLTEDVMGALGARPDQLLLARDHMAIFATEAEVAALTPDMAKIASLNADGVMITAPADDPDIDFVSRFFAPNHGVPEDPVTGSAHCTLVPYWAEKLGKTTLLARQISTRGGDLKCTYLAEEGRVYMAGQAVTYLKGSIFI